MAAVDFMQKSLIQQELVPRDFASIKVVVEPPKPPARPTPPPPPPASTAAATGSADVSVAQLREQLEVLRLQRKQVDGYIKAFQKQGQKDEVEMLQRSKFDIDLELARVERLLKASK